MNKHTAPALSNEDLQAAKESLPDLIEGWRESHSVEEGQERAAVICAIFKKWPFLAKDMSPGKLARIKKEGRGEW